MAAYYNENDPFAAAWLRKLIRAGLIADGEVDERSIEDVRADDLAGFRQYHFFGGIGGWSHALRLAAWPDDRPVWTGSCPCQPFSRAGQRRAFADRRHLWPELARLVRERRPAVIFGEQVAGPAGLAWWDAVSADLEGAGYAVGAADLCAAGVGAPHIRQRLYWCAVAGATGGLADAHGDGRHSGPRDDPPLGHGQTPAPGRVAGRPRPTDGYWRDVDWVGCRDGRRRPVKPGIAVLVDGTPDRVAVLRALGNAIVAPLAAQFIGSVMEAVTI